MGTIEQLKRLCGDQRVVFEIEYEFTYWHVTEEGKPRKSSPEVRIAHFLAPTEALARAAFKHHRPDALVLWVKPLLYIDHAVSFD